MDRSLAAKRGHDQVVNVAINKNNEPNEKRPKNASTNGLRLCAGECKKWKASGWFSNNQKRKGSMAKCMDCTGNVANNDTAKVVTHPPKPPLVALTCFKCKKEKQQEAFSQNQWKKQGTIHADKATCSECNMQPKPEDIQFCCVGCKKSKALSKFNKGEKKKAQSGSGDVTCKECMAQEREEKQRVVEEKRRLWREERDRKLALPRECSECKKSKPKEEYSVHQWSTVSYEQKQKCLDCYPLEKELEDIKEEEEREEAEERKENWFQCHAEFTKLAAEGVFIYDFRPTSLPTRKPDPAELEGSYAIIFHYGYDDANEGDVSRTARGTLTFATNPESRKLVGHIIFDKKFPAGNAYTFNPTYNIAPSDDGALVPVDGRFIVKDLVDPYGVINETGEDQHAFLSIVNKRVGLPWRPKECLNEDEFDLDEMFDEDKLVKFSSLDEAEALMKKHELRNPPQTIPPPVFFLEPDDLCLNTIWYSEGPHGENAESYIIARKVEP